MERDVDAEAAAYNKGLLAGRKEHRSSSPETIREIQELKNEWKDFKKMARNLLVATLTISVGYGIWIGSMQTRVDTLAEQSRQASAERAALSIRVQGNDVSTVEVKTRLANIEAVLIEIRQALNIK